MWYRKQETLTPPVPLYSVLNNRNKYGELEYTMSM